MGFLTYYYCELCGEEIAKNNAGYVPSNIKLTPDPKKSKEKEYYVCVECTENLNPYELISGLLKKANEAPPFISDIYSITITTTKLKRAHSVGENCKEK